MQKSSAQQSIQVMLICNPVLLDFPQCFCLGLCIPKVPLEDIQVGIWVCVCVQYASRKMDILSVKQR